MVRRFTSVSSWILSLKWWGFRNMFSSEKVLQMSYANYQWALFLLYIHKFWVLTNLFRRGKEALVEKFKNSCIMDERESWRPKIFYSTGSNQGLPEPFPSPSHFRRKERSSLNRGALFVPNVPGNSHHLHNVSGNREQTQSTRRTWLSVDR